MDVREKSSNDKRLIDANKLLKNGIRVSYGFDNDGVLLIPIGDVIRSIKDAPTVDAVEVVRCKDCKHRGTDYCIFHINGEPADEELWRKLDNDFCSYGERKEGADNEP